MQGRPGYVVGVLWIVPGVAGLERPAGADLDNRTNTSADAAVLGSFPGCVNAANTVTPNQPDIIRVAISNSITVHTVLTIIDTVDIRGTSNSVGCHDRSAGSQNAFVFAPGSNGSTLTGLALVDNSTAIVLQSDSNRILHCRVGTAGSGSVGPVGLSQPGPRPHDRHLSSGTGGSD